MLFYSGFVKYMGDVDRGDTVLDYLKMERERGITITSAAITFKWRDHTINLIDTPGHVDFTVEVERSVRVLDGAIAIFDAVQGVQAQSETVWHQANRYGVPRIAFLNKMDREGASLRRSVEMINKRLNAQTFITQLPLGSTKNFRGVIDLVSMEEVVWKEDDMGITYEKTPIDESHDSYERAIEARNELVEKVAEQDERVMEMFLDESINTNVPKTELSAALRRLVLANRGIVVLCGSSLKNKGVQLLLDAVIDYLPSPEERPLVEAVMPDNKDKTVQLSPDLKGPLCALAFKVVHHLQRGLIVYFRVYSGTLKAGERILNSTKDKDERTMRLLRVSADAFEDVKEIQAGDIGAAIGLKHTSTGDTLTGGKDDRMVLKGMKVPEPVFFCSIFPETNSQEEPLKNALQTLQLEDPSFRWNVNPDTNQTLISGMGELHLETIVDRILNHYKVNAQTGRIYIAYKATVTQEHEGEFTRMYTVGGKQDSITLKFRISPLVAGKGNNFELDPMFNKDALGATSKQRNEVLSAIEEGVRDSFRSGVPSGFPLVDTNIALVEVQHTGALPHTFKIAAVQAVEQLAREAAPVLLQPIMKVEISVSEEFLGGVLADLSKRGSDIQNMDQSAEGKRMIYCTVPLTGLLGYSTDLRSITKGNASFTMEFTGYEQLDQHEQDKLLEEYGATL
jgi:elongation factor G